MIKPYLRPHIKPKVQTINNLLNTTQVVLCINYSVIFSTFMIITFRQTPSHQEYSLIGIDQRTYATQLDTQTKPTIP